MARAKKKKNVLEAFIKSIEKQRERSRKRLEELNAKKNEEAEAVEELSLEELSK